MARALRRNACTPKAVAAALSVCLQAAFIAEAAHGTVPQRPCWDDSPSGSQPFCTEILAPPDRTVDPVRPMPVFFWTEQEDIDPNLCPLPRYPISARRAGREGVVDLLLKVNEKGRVTNGMVSSSSGHAILDAAALSAFSKCHFRQSTDHRSVVAGNWEVSYKFGRYDTGLYRLPPSVPAPRPPLPEGYISFPRGFDPNWRQ